MEIKKVFSEYCKENNLDFSIVSSIKTYNESTLFCPAGMQQYANLFKKKWIHGTCSNIQSCLRVNDIDEIGDGNHLAYFNMLGLFSFRELTMENAYCFWKGFMKKLGLSFTVTMHPEKQWDFVTEEVKLDQECVWTDGNTSGYCIEFYVNGIEVGNIVNTEEDCIDAGFGLERLDTAVNGTVYNKNLVLKDSILKIIELGVKPNKSKQGYVLRKLLNLAVKNNYKIDHQFYLEEEKRIIKMQEFYNKNKDKYPNQSKEWWKETHGVEL